MSYKSDFYGREIDAQIKYIKESLPTIIESIAKNIETLSKNKAENSSVPSKTSQIENDSDYVSKTFVEAKQKEHAEQIGDIETALDSIIEMQNTLIGGESE